MRKRSSTADHTHLFRDDFCASLLQENPAEEASSLHVTVLERCKETAQLSGRHIYSSLKKGEGKNYLHDLGPDWSLRRSGCSWGAQTLLALGVGHLCLNPWSLLPPCLTLWSHHGPKFPQLLRDGNWKSNCR